MSATYIVYLGNVVNRPVSRREKVERGVPGVARDAEYYISVLEFVLPDRILDK